MFCSSPEDADLSSRRFQRTSVTTAEMLLPTDSRSSATCEQRCDLAEQRSLETQTADISLACWSLAARYVLIASSFPARNLRLKCVSSLNGFVSTTENTEYPPGTCVSRRAKNDGSVALRTPVPRSSRRRLSPQRHPSPGTDARQFSSNSINFRGKDLKSTSRHWSCLSWW